MTDDAQIKAAEHKEVPQRPYRLVDADGELNSYGELLAEERHHGIGSSDDGDRRFSEMGPDVMPGTNVVAP